MDVKQLGIVKAVCSEGKQHTIEVYEHVIRDANGVETGRQIIGRRTGAETGDQDVVQLFSQDPLVFCDRIGFPKYYCDQPS